MHMTVTDALRNRRTTRAFQSARIDRPLLEHLFELAQQSPSNCNTQPWHVVVVSGQARDRLERALMTEINSGNPPNPAFPPGDAELHGIYRERQIDCAVRYYGVMGIERNDREAREALMARNWQFFGAPHVAFLCMPTSMGPVNAIDVGIYLQSLMLLFVEHGISSCPQGALAFFPDPVFEIAQIPDHMGILCGIAFGYAEDNALINEVHMTRAQLDECVRFVD